MTKPITLSINHVVVLADIFETVYTHYSREEYERYLRDLHELKLLRFDEEIKDYLLTEEGEELIAHIEKAATDRVDCETIIL